MAADPTKLLKSVKQYGNKLFGFIKSRVASQEEAEDILQEVWYQLSRVVDLEDLESISGWLFRVARNKITDRYRKQTPELYEDSLFQHETGAEIKDILLGASRSPEDDLFKEMFWQEFTEALNELPDNQREAFVQNELEGRTLREIAEARGENIKTIISRKQYAVKHLRKRLKRLYDDL